MFKKLLSNLPFNPSLIQEVSFYAKRLHKEESLRRGGLVLVALAMGVQMFAAIAPAEASNQGSGNDIIYGGFTSASQAASKCDQNSQNFKTILAYYQINCAAVRSAGTRTIRSTDYGGNLDSMGRWSYGARIRKNTNQYDVTISGTKYYMKNLWSWDSGAYSTYKVLELTNTKGERMWLMYDCGNIITNGPYAPPKAPVKPKPAVADIELATCDAKNRRNRLYGWAFDGDRPTSSLTITLYIDGKKVGNYTTNKTRSEINRYIRTTGKHGFFRSG